MGPQRTYDLDTLREVIREVMHEELKAAFGPAFGSSRDDPNERVHDMFFFGHFAASPKRSAPRWLCSSYRLSLRALPLSASSGSFHFQGLENEPANPRSAQ